MTTSARSAFVLWPLVLLVVFVGTFRRVVTDSTAVDALDCSVARTGADVVPHTTARDIGWLERCIAQDPDDVELLIELGAAHQAAGRDQVAESIYRRALDVDPRAGTVHVRLGELLIKHGDRAGAYREAELALRWHPGNAPALDLANRSASPALLASDQ